MDGVPRPGDLPGQLGQVRSRVLAALDPRPLVRGAVRDLPAPDAIVAVGKAAPRMHAGALDGLGGGARSLMIAPPGVGAPGWALVADHPVPTERNVAAAQALRRFIDEHRGADARFLVLISGGASALLAWPAEGVGLGDLRTLTEALLASGATIDEINTVRKHVERLKGGRLAALCAPSRVDGLIISDVPGADVSVIGSGPLSGDPSTYGDALGVLERYGVTRIASVRAHLERGARGGISETPEPGDLGLDRVSTRVIAGNADAVAAACAACAELGYRVTSENGVQGEAAEVGRSAARRLGGPGSALVLGGETTVTLGAGAGRGGRNQELALACALELEALGLQNAAVMALATDGVDGPTDAAGAVVTGGTVGRARKDGVDLERALSEHDSHTALDALGVLIRTGATGTNVADLVVGVVGSVAGE